MTTKINNKNFLRLIIFMIGFYTIWICRAVLSNYIDEKVTSEWGKVIVSFIFKFTFWLVPVFLYLKFIDKKSFKISLGYLKINKIGRKQVLWLTGIMIMGTLWAVFTIKIKDADVHFRLRSIVSNMINAALIEEIFFRGFIFQKVSEILGDQKSAVLNAFLFVFIHYPGWIIINNASVVEICKDSIYIFIFALVMCFILRKSESLFPGILFHTINNLISNLK